MKILEKINFASPYTELPKDYQFGKNLEVYARLYNVENIRERLDEIFEYFELGNLLEKKQENYLLARKPEYH